jgi:superfamily II DNA or RNA helicase
LAAVDRARVRGDRSAYVVLPPGAGKTLVGLEAVRRIGRPALVLGPNTAIQAQWAAQWREFTPRTVEVSADRELPTPLTVLTYQAVCVLDPEWSADEPESSSGRGAGGASSDPLGLLHPNGQELVGRLRAAGPLTLVLDECHHLLELWGHLLRAVVAELAEPFVLGLTATPPSALTAAQAEVHAALFGHVDYEVAAPAVVRDGDLAPYQELAWLTAPTPAERDYIHGEAERFAELRTDLLDPDFGSTPFLDWLQRRLVDRQAASAGPSAAAGAGPNGGRGGRSPVPASSWERFERAEPDLAAAALRLHVAGLLPLPDGARVREQHRHPPTAADWVALLDDWTRRCLRPSDHLADAAALEAVRRALPSVGYRLTRAGIRSAQSPVDRVLARSASKGAATVEILRAEAAELGSRLRAVVLCDHEAAAAELPARLAGVLDPQAGGARLALETLVADPGAAELDPVLLTGRAVACGRDTGERLIEWLRGKGVDAVAAPVAAPMATSGATSGATTAAQAVEVSAGGGWSPRRYVPLVTRFFEAGGSRCLVGTRGLLGEGWDARSVNVLVDLTTATTPTAVVQARGRALRLDASWPGKVADNWAVVCVSDGHPKGAADYERFVRKHDGYFALTHDGDIESGVSHVDPEFSPYHPPPPQRRESINVAMLARVGERESARDRWRVGAPYDDEPVRTVIVRAGRQLGLAGRAIVASGPAQAAQPGPGESSRRRTRWWRLPDLPPQAALADIAAAVADGLHAAGLLPAGSAAVRVAPLPDGAYRALVAGVPAAESELFAASLDEVVSPLAAPRYVIPRLVLTPPATRWAALRLVARLALRRAFGRRVPAAVIYHAVPAALGVNRRRVAYFEQAWNAWVSPGAALYTGSPEGAGVLAAQRGDDPFDITTALRTLWR